MIGLVLLWLTSLVLAASAVAIMVALVVARALRMERERRRLVARKRLLPLFLSASDGEASEAVLAEARRAPDITADLAVELFELVRGDDTLRLANLFRAAGVQDVLQQRLRGGDEQARILAAETLAFFPGEATLRALETALHDRSGEVRLATAIALAELASAPPLRDLVLRIGSGTAERSRRVVELFRRMADERKQELLEVAVDPAVAPLMRAAAVEALARTGDYGLVPALAEIARGAEAASPELVAQCVRALGELGHPNGRAVVAWALASADWQVRAEAAEAAGRIGLTDAAPRLSLLLEDDVWWVRFRAGEALAALGETGREVLRQLADAGSGRNQRTAALVLAERGLA